MHEQLLAEQRRVVSIYNDRWKDDLDRYSLIQPGEFLMQAEYMRKLFVEIRNSVDIHENSRILEIGCGTCPRLIDFLYLNIPLNNIVGVDIHFPSLAWAKKNRFQGALVQADGAVLPFDNKTFTIILLRTVFSSIMNDELIAQIARETLRMLDDEGMIVIYDFVVSNPANKNVRAIRPAQIHRMFPDTQIKQQTLTVAPPLVRFIDRHFSTSLVYDVLSMVPFVKTHRMWTIRRPRVRHNSRRGSG